MDRRRILFFDQAPAVGGSVISLYHLVANIDQARFEPVVLLRASNTYAPKFRALGIKVYTYGSAKASPSQHDGHVESVRHGRIAGVLRKTAAGLQVVHAIGFVLRALPGIQRDAKELSVIMREVRPDLVHLNDVVCVNRAAIMASRRCGLPAICHIRAISTRNAFDRWQSRSLRGFICISRAVRDHMVTLGGKSDPHWVVYNGLDLEDFENLDGSLVRGELGISEEQPLIGCVARLVPWKGVHVFVEAMAEVLSAHPEAHALIVGSPEHNTTDYAQRVAARVTELGLQDKITMQGFRSDIAELLAGMDVMVHASVAPEPFGRIVIEGMAAGATVIGTRDGAVPEILNEEETGLLVSPGDAHDMADAVMRAIEFPVEAASWRVAARTKVEDCFTVQRYVAGVEAVYDQLISL